MTAIYEQGASLDDAVRLARGFQAASVWRDVEIDDAAIRVFLANMEASPDAYLEIAKDGGVGGLVMPLWFAPSIVVGVEMFWYSERAGDGERLRASFETWARSKGAHIVQFSCMLTEREPALRRMYRRAGFEAVELAFRKAL